MASIGVGLGLPVWQGRFGTSKMGTSHVAEKLNDKKFATKYSLPEGTFGCFGLQNTIYVFGSATQRGPFGGDLSTVTTSRRHNGDVGSP